MALVDHVAGFLLSTDPGVRFGLSRLDFSVDGMRVNPEGYAEMGHKLRQGAIEVRQIGTQASDGQADAVYTPALDRLSLRPGVRLDGSSADVIGQQAGVIHEITHALFDFHGYKTSNAIEEAVAYIAEALYATARMLRRSDPNPLSNAILSAALSVVTGRRMLNHTGLAIPSTSPDIKALVAAIRAHPVYPDSDAANHADGVFGGLMNPWYPSASFD